MPNLDNLPVPLYSPLHPYHWEYDNLPLQALKSRDDILSGAINNAEAILRDSIGSQGSLANRLNQSLDENGDLFASAIDDALHSIAEHTDDSKILTEDEMDVLESLGYELTNPVEFIRMIQAERDKLALIASEATNLKISVETPSNIVLFEQGTMTLEDSATISWQVVDSTKVRANLGFPTESAHGHYYDVEPVTSDYISFEVNTVATPYIEGSLRVYVNGIRLSSSADVYVPGALVTDSWTLVSFTEDPENGLFDLSTSITSDDIIRVDFDISFV